MPSVEKNMAAKGTGRMRSVGDEQGTARWVGGVTLAALAFLILIRRGFRGVSVGVGFK